MYDMTIGQRIKELRISKGMTQRQVGDKCGMPDSAIRKYELGTQTPKISTLEKIADALDADIVYLLKGYTISELEKTAGENSLEDVNEWIKSDYVDSEGARSILRGEKAADEVYLQATKDLSEQVILEMLMDEFNQMNRMGQFRAVEFLATLNDNPRFRKGR